MSRIRELDSIRGIAALTIVFFHLWFPRVGALGLGVNLFFVLSGFLITAIILDHAPNPRFLVAFYARRGLRIWPIYYLALAGVVLVYRLPPLSGDLSEWPSYFAYVQCLSHSLAGREPTFPIAFQHTWSLAIEEQFYLFWPALILLIGRRGLPVLAAVLVATAVLARSAGISHFILITNVDGLAMGGWLAYFLDGSTTAGGMGSSARRRLAALAIAAAGLGTGILALASGLHAGRPGLLPSASINSLKLLAANVLFLALVSGLVLHAGHPRLGWLRDRRLVYLGTISYGIYLYHHIIIKIWEDLSRHYEWAGTRLIELGVLGSALGLASLSWHFVERPILALKDRFSYEAAPAPEFAGDTSPAEPWAAEAI
jgi:peptidoglycan/LPS O-acetylase OafA/YrhL